MKGRKKHYLILFILISNLFFLFMISKSFIYEDYNDVYKVSVIIKGKNSESWMIIKEGIDQAAFDMNLDINFITLSEDNNLEEQENLIKREVDDGMDALIIAPVDYVKMTDVIKEVKEKVPVVLIESTIQNVKNTPYVSCDNYLLGRSLAEEVIRSGNYRKNIVILNSDTSYSSVQERYRGFEEEIKKSKNNYELWEINDDGVDGIEYSKNLIKDKDVDVLVALEPSKLEMLAQAKKELSLEYDKVNNIEIYGVGSTSKVISLLEENIINSIVVQNEFNIGYLGVQAAVDLIKDEKINNKSIDFSIISKMNMYSNENQRLLFPFVR